MMLRRERFLRGLAVWGLLAPLFLLPVCRVLGGAVLAGDGREALAAFLSSPVFRRVLAFTLAESLCSALGSVLLALPGAYLLGRHRFPGRDLLRNFLILPFMLPAILAVLAMVVFYGRNGAVNHALGLIFGPGAPRFTGLYGFAGIVLTHVFYNSALALRIIGEAWERLDPRLIEAAHTLGAGPCRAWRSVALPVLLPSISAAFVLSFIYASLSFTVVLVFGGLRFRTFEVLIYSRLNQDLDFAGACAVAFFQMFLAGVLLAIRAAVTRAQRRVSSAFVPAPDPGRMGARARVFLLGYVLLLILFYLGPLAGLFLRAFRERGAPDGAFTLVNFAALLGPGFRTGTGAGFLEAATASLVLALAVGLAVACLAYIFTLLRAGAPPGLTDAALELPLGVSLVTLCFGLLNLYGRRLPPVALVAWAQTLTGLPLGYMIVRAARAGLPPELFGAARTLGAGWWRRKLEIELPLLRRALLTAFAFGAAFSLGDVASVLVLAQGRVITLAVAVYRLAGHYRFPQALALGAVLLLLSLGLFMLADRTAAGERAGGWRAA